MITYIIAVQLCLFILWAIYHWGLKSLPHYRFNRLFLWLIPIFSLSIPLLEIEIGLAQGVDIIEAQFVAPPSENAPPLSPQLVPIAPFSQDSNTYSIYALLSIVYGIGIGVLLSKSLSSVLQLRQQLASNQLSLVQAPNVYAQDFFSSSFSFGRQIYLGSDWNRLTPQDRSIVLSHEQAHIALKHRYDLYYFHLIRALFWFHPAAHLLLRSAKHLHEYQADQSVIDAGYDFSAYAQLLLKLQSKQKAPSSFSFAIAEHPLKTRIKMLKTKSSIFTSGKYYLLAILLIGGLITGIGYYFNSFACLQLQINIEESATKATETLVIEERKETKLDRVSLQVFSQLNPDIPEYQPIDARMISGFGMRTHPISKKQILHRGIDYYAPIGTSVKASADGKVIFVSENEKDNYGIQTILQHANGYKTRYAHLDQVIIELGQAVKQGEEIALSGNTGLSKGPHLHYEVMHNGRPIDPMPLFKPTSEDNAEKETHH
ncbi:MAG: peptidoglycan DD-metalloendopeptidase family protein [Bacteroidia bacterium]